MYLWVAAKNSPSRRHLRPGGHIEIVYFDFHVRGGKTLSKEGPTAEFFDELMRMTAELGRPFHLHWSTIQSWLEYAGFHNVNPLISQLPLGCDKFKCDRCTKEGIRKGCQREKCYPWPGMTEGDVLGQRYLEVMMNATALQSISNAVFAVHGNQMAMPLDEQIQSVVEETSSPEVHAWHEL